LAAKSPKKGQIALARGRVWKPYFGKQPTGGKKLVTTEGKIEAKSLGSKKIVRCRSTQGRGERDFAGGGMRSNRGGKIRKDRRRYSR